MSFELVSCLPITEFEVRILIRLFSLSAPNELIVLSTDAQQKVFGVGTRCSKENTSYESVAYKGFQNLEAATNREEHRKRRQIWDKAFSTKGKLQLFDNCCSGSLDGTSLGILRNLRSRNSI